MRAMRTSRKQGTIVARCCNNARLAFTAKKESSARARCINTSHQQTTTLTTSVVVAAATIAQHFKCGQQRKRVYQSVSAKEAARPIQSNLHRKILFAAVVLTRRCCGVCALFACVGKRLWRKGKGGRQFTQSVVRPRTSRKLRAHEPTSYRARARAAPDTSATHH